MQAESSHPRRAMGTRPELTEEAPSPGEAAGDAGTPPHTLASSLPAAPGAQRRNEVSPTTADL